MTVSYTHLDVYKRQKNVSGIRFVYLKALDVVRHPVVQRIIERYEDNDEEKKAFND